MSHLQSFLKKKNRKIIGLMSGTSCDGVDLALIEINQSNTQFKFVAGYHKSYTKIQKNTILDCLDLEKSDPKKISQLNFYLAEIWAKAISEMINKYSISKETIDLIGSHGHTIWHQPEKENFGDRKISSTLQLGDPAVLAQLTGITTVGDFRVADVAIGGQGAPLVPYFDWLYFRQFKQNILALNIGGISNFTFIPADGNLENVVAFDCGPGNMLIDQLMQRLYELPYDKGGRIAKLGKFSQRLFDHLLKTDNFIKIKPPKSTGREHYGKVFILNLLKKSLRSRIQEPEIIHTVTKYTAFVIHDAYRKFISPKHRIELLVVSGGGSRNPFLMNALKQHFTGIKIKTSGEVGLEEDFKEAICFAVLANELIEGRKTNLPQVTGSKQQVLLGKICL